MSGFNSKFNSSQRQREKTSDILFPPENIALVEIQQDIITSELCFTLAVNPLVSQVLIHLLQALQAFSHVLIVDFGIKGGHGLFTQVVSTVDVKASALLNQRHHQRVAEVLLGYVLTE